MMIWFLDTIKSIKLEGDKVDKMVLKNLIPETLTESLILQSNIFKTFSEEGRFYVALVAPYY